MALITNTLKLIEHSEDEEYRRSWTGTEYTRTANRKVYEQDCTPGTTLTAIGSPGGSYVEVSSNYSYNGGGYAKIRTIYETITDWSS